MRWLGNVQGMNEAVSLAGNIDDVTHSVRAVPECLPEGCNVRSQAAFVDDGSLPDLLHEVLLGHHLSSIADEQDEDVEGSASQRNGLPVPVEPPFGRVEPEGSEAGEREFDLPPGVSRRRFRSGRVVTETQGSLRVLARHVM